MQPEAVAQKANALPGPKQGFICSSNLNTYQFLAQEGRLKKKIKECI